MSLFDNVKKLLKVNNELPVPIKEGTCMVNGDTGVNYIFDGKHWNRIEEVPPTVPKTEKLVNTPSNHYTSPFAAGSIRRSPPYVSTPTSSSSRHSDRSYSSSDSFSSYSSCDTSSDSSSSCDSGGSCGD